MAVSVATGRGIAIPEGWHWSRREHDGDSPPAVSHGCPWHDPGLESRAGESEAFDRYLIQ